MRHRKAGVKLNRSSSHRKAMFRNMVTSLFKYDRIKTTDVRAKEVSRWADHIITLAKRGDLHARRQAMAIVREKNVVHKLFEEAKERFGKRNGGYTRVIKIGRRPGDAALVSLIELVLTEEQAKKKKKKGKTATKKAAPAQQPTAPETTEESAAEAKQDTAGDSAEAKAAPDGEIAEAAPAAQVDPEPAAQAAPEDRATEAEEVAPRQSDADAAVEKKDPKSE